MTNHQIQTFLSLPSKESDKVEFKPVLNNAVIETLVAFSNANRNRQIAKLVKEMGLIERYGTGIKRVRKMFLDYGLEEPVFEIMSGGLAVTVCGLKDLSKAGEKGTEKITNNQQKIIDNIAKNPHITSEELAFIVGIRADKIRVNLAKLKSNGLIERVGADKGGYWRVK